MTDILLLKSTTMPLKLPKSMRVASALVSAPTSMASFLHPYCIVLLWLVWLNEFLLIAVRSLQFPHEDCNAVSIIESKAKCRPYPAIEVMMDHITLRGKKLSTIKRLSPSHVMIHQCSGIKHNKAFSHS